MIIAFHFLQRVHFKYHDERFAIAFLYTALLLRDWLLVNDMAWYPIGKIDFFYEKDVLFRHTVPWNIQIFCGGYSVLKVLQCSTI